MEASPPSTDGAGHGAARVAEAAAIEVQNAQLRDEILQVHKALEELEPLPEETDEGPRRLAALEAELARVEASLFVLHSHKPDGILSRSALCVEEQARAEVMGTVQELKKTLAWETARKEEEEALLARDEILLADAEALHTTLSGRAAAAVTAAAAATPRAAGETLVLHGRVAHLSRRFKVLQAALVGFVDGVLADPRADARFATPPSGAQMATASDEEGGEGGQGDTRPRKRRRVVVQGSDAAAFNLRTWIREDPLLSSSSDSAAGIEGKGEGETRAFQLKKLIETLMNLSITRPGDPWLATLPSSAAAAAAAATASSASEGDDAKTDADADADATGRFPFAPELVAFVLRAGIAHEDPRTAGRIRLVDFAGVAT
ncbi:hypothetical protein JCM3770_001116 [Rhodotorula araucariae]